MLLHHSQTFCLIVNFLIRLVSYAFTSFSNDIFADVSSNQWLVSYAFTSFSNGRRAAYTSNLAGILCFYIILKQETVTKAAADGLVSYAFTSFSNLSSLPLPREFGLVSYAFTSFSNNGTKAQCIREGWYLMLLHHSQTVCTSQTTLPQGWYLMLLHHSQTTRCIN